jgi:hypothetical protein
LLEYIRDELKVSADRVRKIVGRNRFLDLGESEGHEYHQKVPVDVGSEPQAEMDPTRTRTESGVDR